MEVTPDRWEKVKELFESALKLDAAERVSFVASSCPEADVRRTVEKLLSYHEEAGNFLEVPWNTSRVAAVPRRAQVFGTGDTLSNRFRVTAFIAEGGAGEVYEAEDLELRQQVAIKTIRKDLLGDPDVMERFRREVFFAKAVTHPNICRIFDLFRHQTSALATESVLFVSMEMLRGETLASRLRRGRMSPEEALPIVVQLCSALDAAHTAGIVHRDLKPANVILAAGQEPGQMRTVITDFGIAFGSRAEFGLSLTPAGQVIGTPEWMSPEQVEGHEPTAASDVYALGLILYRMMTGTNPFEANSPVSSALKRLKEEPPSPRQAAPTLPASWEAVILKCLERKSAHRFNKATEVSQALMSGSVPRRSRAYAKIKGAAGVAAVLAIVLLATYAAHLKHFMSTPPRALRKWERLSINIAGHIPDPDPFNVYQWKDMVWVGPRGWLAGSIGGIGGGEGMYLGRGILLFTEDGGASWKEVSRENFASGRGTLSCFGETWDNVSSISNIDVIRRTFPGGKPRFEGWLASISGVYFTDDATNVNSRWRRVTPRPDGPDCYSQFGDFAGIGAFRETYAAGWQGIAHWTRGYPWRVQKTTHTYPISRLFIRGDANRDGWAVGRTGDDGPGYTGSDSHGAIYHLDWPGNSWSRVPLPDIDFAARQGLNDVIQADDNTVLAVGDGGIIVRGTRTTKGEWSWHTMPTPTKNSLKSVALDEAGHFWVAGSSGTVLTGDRLAATWRIETLRDQTDAPVVSNFFRIRIVGDTVWVLGDGVVLKSRGP
jgi:photosystem II stability/assembly factor-like uncharacterized protein